MASPTPSVFGTGKARNGGPLVMRITSRGITVTRQSRSRQQPRWSHSRQRRTMSTAILPAFPQLWINEVQAENVTGITNRAGQRTPWLELYNPAPARFPSTGFTSPIPTPT